MGEFVPSTKTFTWNVPHLVGICGSKARQQFARSQSREEMAEFVCPDFIVYFG